MSVTKYTDTYVPTFGNAFIAIRCNARHLENVYDCGKLF